jgi:dimethylhistidine N-methyltransferase
MTTTPFPAIRRNLDEQVASAAWEGLTSHPKQLPPWLFYDEAGSRLFNEITDLPEYYVTRTERSILTAHAGEIMAQAAQGYRLRLTELGAGSADKTRLLLAAAVAQQSTVIYEPIDVSATFLETARDRIEREIAGVTVLPRVMDYTNGLALVPNSPGERRLVLYIGSSIGNFEPSEALRLLKRLRATLQAGDGLLLGVDLVKDEPTLAAAYDDQAGITAAFNRNILTRLNRELDADFDLQSFAHRALWNPAHSRIEMHLESRVPHTVRVAALDIDINFAAGETIHTENSYKYLPGQPEALMSAAGFELSNRWTDPQGWFAVCLGKAH